MQKLQRIVKALISFIKLTDSKLELMCNSIMQAMTGNANFTTPIPTLPVIQDVLDNYSAALIAAASRDRNKVALKNQYRNQLIELMRQLGNYVNTVCMGDVAMLTSSGFTLSKLPLPRHLTVPQNLIILQGLNVGTMVAKVNPVNGATSYLFEVVADSPNKNGNWLSFPSSRTKFEFEGLTQGQKYWFRVAAVGTNGQVVYGSEVSQFVMQRNIDMAA